MVWTTCANQMPIVIAPVVMAELGISGSLAGLTLALPFLIIVPLLMYFDRIVRHFTLERSILTFGTFLVIGTVGTGFSMTVEIPNVFVALYVVFGTIKGISMAGLYCCEGMLMLQNSRRNDRVKNNGYIKAANGVGAILLPCIISACVALSGWWLCFIVVSAALAATLPYTYAKCVSFKETLEIDLSFHTESQLTRSPELRDLIKSRYTVMAFTVWFAIIFLMGIANSTMTYMLIDLHEIEESKATLVTSITRVSFVLGTPVLNLIIERNWLTRLGCIQLGILL